MPRGSAGPLGRGSGPRGPQVEAQGQGYKPGGPARKSLDMLRLRLSSPVSRKHKRVEVSQVGLLEASWVTRPSPGFRRGPRPWTSRLGREQPGMGGRGRAEDGSDLAGAEPATTALRGLGWSSGSPRALPCRHSRSGRRAWNGLAGAGLGVEAWPRNHLQRRWRGGGTRDFRLHPGPASRAHGTGRGAAGS